MTPRPQPHDLEAETSVLGAILLDSASLMKVLDCHLEPEHFYRESNGHVYQAALNLFRRGEPVDNVTLGAELERLGTLDRVGGRAQLALLQESVPTAANAAWYGDIVKELASKRKLIAVGAEVTALGYEEAVSGDEAVNQAQAKVYGISDERTSGGLNRLYDLLRPAMDAVDAQMADPHHLRGIPSGFLDVDRLTNGWQRGDLIVIAGRPSMGKTSFALNVARHAAVEEQRPVVIFSLEMSKEQLVERLLCEQAGIDAQRMHRGMLSEREYFRLSDALGPLGDAPIFIDDTPALDELTLKLKARQAKAREGIDMVILDYLQLMHGRTRGGEPNRVQEVSVLSRSLKETARELHLPFLAMSQLSRAPEQRPDKRPILSDLRESGSIEQDADVVMFLYRDDYYKKDSEKPGIAEVNVAKHRNGPTGTVDLLFRRELTRFENLERRTVGEDKS